jgi:hypothetical protein
VLADEWVFITSQSIGVFRAGKRGVKRAFDAFRRAGRDVDKVSDQSMKSGLEARFTLRALNGARAVMWFFDLLKLRVLVVDGL